MFQKLLILLVLIGSLAYLFIHITRPFSTNAAISYDSGWGAAGSANGEFNDPMGVAVDRTNGWVYVAEAQNDRIQKFDTSGNYLTKWGSSGTNPGEFGMLSDIALDSAGNIYTVDTGQSRVQVFDSNGNFLRQWNLPADGYGIAVDSNNDVYVADGVGDQILKYQSDGTPITSWGTTGNGDGQFDLPWGIAIDSSDRIYVTEYDNSRVQIFDSSGNYISKWTTPGGATPNTWGQLIGVVVDTAGHIIVADNVNNRLVKLLNDGTFLEEIDSADGNGFGTINGIDFDNSDFMYVADTNNNRMLKFSNTDPTSTPAPQNNSQGGENTSSEPYLGPPPCTAQTPSEIPELFRIDTAGTYVNVYFTKTELNTTGYSVSYGVNNTASQYSDSFDYNGPEWVIGRTITHLLPNTEYYFKVQSLNGCNAGTWSPIKKAKTRGRLADITSFFSNLKPFNSLSSKINASPPVATKNPITTCDYTVLKNDSLWGIAQRKWGLGYLYNQILTLNPNLSSTLRIGQQLRLCE